VSSGEPSSVTVWYVEEEGEVMSTNRFSSMLRGLRRKQSLPEEVTGSQPSVWQIDEQETSLDSL
jgi:hypothetical protein